MNGVIVREYKKIFPFYIKEEKGGFAVFKIYDEHNLTKKKLLKKINKKHISDIAFDNNISENFKAYFLGKVSVISKEDVLFSNMDKMVLKLANSLGIKDGKLSLGLIPGYKTDILINKTESLKNKLKILNVFCDNRDDFLKYADLFYGKTGVPVIIKERFDNIDCDILFNADLKKRDIGNFKGHIIDIFEVMDCKGVKDIKTNFKENKNIYNISDAVFSKILSEPLRIDSFITKNT